ncbi:MAG: hypothetical protein RLZZ401_1527 [Pseudomonadota bacterium]
MIETCQLRYSYPHGKVLAFADVRVAQGATLLLKGRSGAGKSTWLALVAGLMAPGAGTLTVAGQALTTLQPAARDAWRARTVGFLPQKLHLSPSFSVADNLGLAYYAAGRPRDATAIAHTLGLLGVAELAGSRPLQLSGGQAQRVALARAVLLNPQVILADEPTASLDDAAAQAAIALLDSTARRLGATLVIATHDARVATWLPAFSLLDLG